jgi:hypothetical protein
VSTAGVGVKPSPPIRGGWSPFGGSDRRRGLRATLPRSAIAGLCASVLAAQPVVAQDELLPHADEYAASDPTVREVREIAAEIGRRLGAHLTRPIVVLGDYVQEALPHPPGATHSTTLAVADAMRPVADPAKPGYRMWVPQRPPAEQRMDTCVIGISVDLATAPPLTRTSYLAHEVMHCYQRELLTFDGFIAMPEWVKEGTAQFVGEDYAGVGTVNNEPYWRRYLTDQSSLFDRSYDAMGFFFHLKSRGVDPYRSIKQAVLASAAAAEATPGSSSALLMAVIRADGGDAVFSEWPTSLARRSDLGGTWDLVAPGITSDTRAPLVGSVSEGAPFELTVDAAQQKLVYLAFPRGEVLRLAIEGYGGIHWDPTGGNGRTELYTLGHIGSYCVAGTCTCPDGSTPPGVREVQSTPAFIAVSGAETSGRIVAEARSVE